MNIPEMSDERLNRPSSCQRIDGINFGNGLCRDCNRKQAAIVRIMKEFDSTSEDLHEHREQYKKFSKDLDGAYSLCTSCQIHVCKVLNKKSNHSPKPTNSPTSTSFPLKRRSSSTSFLSLILRLISLITLVASCGIVCAIDWYRIEIKAPLPVLKLSTGTLNLMKQLDPFRPHFTVASVVALVTSISLHRQQSKNKFGLVIVIACWILFLVADLKREHLPDTFFMMLPVFSTITALLSLVSCLFGHHYKTDKNHKHENHFLRQENNDSISLRPDVKDVQSGIHSLSLHGSFDETFVTGSTRDSPCPSTSSGDEDLASVSSRSSILKPAKFNPWDNYSTRTSTSSNNKPSANHNFWLDRGYKVQQQQVAFQGMFSGNPYIYWRQEQVIEPKYWQSSSNRKIGSIFKSEGRQKNDSFTKYCDYRSTQDDMTTSTSSLSFSTVIYTLVTLFFLILFTFWCHHVSYIITSSPKTTSNEMEPVALLHPASSPSGFVSDDNETNLYRYCFCSTLNNTALQMYYTQILVNFFIKC